MTISLSCPECNVEFLKTRKDKIYCSRKCARKNYNHNNFVELLCPRCNGIFKIEKCDHNRRTKLGRDKIYCSKGCSSVVSNQNRAQKRILKCENCGKEQEVLESDWREKYCSQECYREHDKERLVKLARRVGQESAEKISKTIKEKYANGYVHPWIGRSHSQGTKERISQSKKEYYETHNGYWKDKKISEKSKQKMSETKTKNWIEGKYDHLKMCWAKGKYFFQKANKEVFYRSSWELGFMKYLDSCDDVSVCEYELLRIPYCDPSGRKRNYIPDILAYYKNGEKTLYEIKPIAHKDSEINKLKFVAAMDYCQNNNILFKVITQKELKELGIL